MERASTSPMNRPWLQLLVGVLCMTMIANLQYGWTLFVGPIDAKHHWGRAAIQVAFTIFVLLETWLVPVEGWLVDRYGPRWVVVGGGVMCAMAWSINAIADSLWLLYVAAALGGVGAGAVYGTCIGNAVKWFPARRGLAAGITAAGFGAGSALTVIPIAAMIATNGYEQTFLTFGLLQGLVVVALGFTLSAPPAQTLSRAVAPGAATLQATPMQMVRTPVFWLMYVMFVLMAAGGLMATAQLAPIANDYKVANVAVTLVGLTLPALTFALALDRVLNGVCRPFFGWVSDHIGRENTMFVAFTCEGLGILALARFGSSPVAFVLLSGLVFFAWGEIYSLFPATVTDTYGARFATANTGLMYTAKGTAALLVPLANVMMARTGSWYAVFLTAAAFNLVAAALALLVLKPMRRRLVARAERIDDPATAVAHT